MSEPQHGKRGLLSAINDFLRWLLFVVLVTAAAAALVLYVVQVRLDEEIRSRIESRFQANYPRLKVTVQSARRIPGVGIEIRGIRVSEPSRDDPRDALAAGLRGRNTGPLQYGAWGSSCRPGQRAGNSVP